MASMTQSIEIEGSPPVENAKQRNHRWLQKKLVKNAVRTTSNFFLFLLNRDSMISSLVSVMSNFLIKIMPVI